MPPWSFFRGQRGSWSYAQYWTCSTGAPSTPTPTGEYTVTGKGLLVWTWVYLLLLHAVLWGLPVPFNTVLPRELLIPWTAGWECIFHKAACVCPSIALNGFGITCPCYQGGNLLAILVSDESLLEGPFPVVAVLATGKGPCRWTRLLFLRSP